MTPARAFTKSLNILNHRPLSKKALGDRLVKDGATPEVAAQTLARLESAGLLNDRQLAESVVRGALAGKPAGARMLLLKLRRKGIPQDLAAEVVAQAVEPEEAKEQALEKAVAFARSKLRAMTRLEPLAKKRRLYGALARRGLSPDTVAEVLEGVRAEIGR